MLETGWFTTAEDWVETHVLGAHEFATFGFAMAVLLCLGLLYLLMSGVRALVTRLRNAAGARAFRRSKEPGYRILLARPIGPGAGRAGKWLTTALGDHLAEFNFGAPFRIAATGRIAGNSDQKILAQARRRLAAADADMLVWASRIGKGDNGLVVQGLSRGGGLRPDEARAFSIGLPGRSSALAGQARPNRRIPANRRQGRVRPSGPRVSCAWRLLPLLIRLRTEAIISRQPCFA